MISLKSYRRAAVPLLAVQTSDPAEVVRTALKETENTEFPVLLWDCIHGITALNENARDMANDLNEGQEPSVVTGNPVEALRAMEKMQQYEQPGKAITIAHGLTEVLDDPQSGIPAKQALWNLRDILPKQGHLLILTAPMGWRNPFPDDIAVLIAPLPSREMQIEAANKLCKSAGVPSPNKRKESSIGDALLGLSSFAAEQALALSMTKQGIEAKVLWERKRQQISETPGLSVYAGNETFDDLGGLNQAKEMFRRILNGKRKPGAIVFIDEIEKSISSNQFDTSGVSQDQLGSLLTYMQDHNASGTIFIGPPGAAKSAMAKAIGNEGKIPTVTLDLGGIKGSLVGESEARMRKALSVISAISGDRPFFVATCNAISMLPPELRRRFTAGTLFFDLPDEKERNTIWPIYLKKYKLNKKDKRPRAIGWTGAEIRQCCDMADRLGVPLIEAASYVVPVAVSAKERIESLRKEANGRYLSASNDGIYKYNKISIGVNG